jgi:hypothetical protein
MRKLLSQGLVMFAGLVSVPATIHIAGKIPVSKEARHDPRLDTLRRFFQRAACPAAELAQDFLTAADDYQLDWRLLPSISLVESEGGKTAIGNNLFGWDAGRAEFASLAAGIRAVADRLANSRLYRDKDLDGILAVYNPHEDYAERVKMVMRQIAPSE